MNLIDSGIRSSCSPLILTAMKKNNQSVPTVIAPPKYKCTTVACRLVLKRAAVQEAAHKSVIDRTDGCAIWALRLQPKYKRLQMALAVYLKCLVCSGCPDGAAKPRRGLRCLLVCCTSVQTNLCRSLSPFQHTRTCTTSFGVHRSLYLEEMTCISPCQPVKHHTLEGFQKQTSCQSAVSVPTAFAWFIY